MCCKYLSKKKAKELRKPLTPIIEKVRQDIKKEKDIWFSPMIVGSARRNMIMQKGNSEVDTDYQLNFSGKKSKDLLPSLKLDVYNLFKKHFPNKDWKISISTSVLTIIKEKDGKKDRSFDLAIIRTIDGESEIIKGKKEDEGNGDNFAWTQMGKLNDAYSKFRKASHPDIKKIKEKYLNKKCSNFDLDKDDQKPSAGLFKEAVNEVI